MNSIERQQFNFDFSRLNLFNDVSFYVFNTYLYDMIHYDMISTCDDVSRYEWYVYTWYDENEYLVKQYESIKRRRSRLYERVKYLFRCGECWFLTITLDDDHIKYKYSSIKKYLEYYLKNISDFYIANLDYGSLDYYEDDNGDIRKGTGRLHFHAIVVIDNLNYCQLNSWRLGHVKAKKIKNHEKSGYRLTEYISKVSNHGVKESTRCERAIYSKKVRDYQAIKAKWKALNVKKVKNC